MPSFRVFVWKMAQDADQRYTQRLSTPLRTTHTDMGACTRCKINESEENRKCAQPAYTRPDGGCWALAVLPRCAHKHTHTSDLAGVCEITFGIKPSPMRVLLHEFGWRRPPAIRADSDAARMSGKCVAWRSDDGK